MRDKRKILLVEDERMIANFLSALLGSGDYQVLRADTGREGLSMAASHSPDLVLLDLGLPDLDGMEVLRGIRQWSEVPIIVVSARQEEAEKVAALDAGANDYVTKPFGNDELLARVRSALRLQARSGRSGTGLTFSVGALQIDYEKRQVRVDGNAVHLTPIEYKIVVLLSRNAGKVLTHEQMLREVWGPFAGDSQVLRVNMANIRRKIEPDPASPRYVITEMGVGYRMIEEMR